jgi:putative ABC transport system permease protein
LKPASIAVLGAGALGFVTLLLAVSRDLKLGAIAVGGFAVAVAFFALLSWVAVQVLRRAVPEAGAPRWLVLATRQIAARPGFAVLQVSALSVGLLALVLLVLLRTDLIDSWRKATPEGGTEPLRDQRRPREQGPAFQTRRRGIRRCSLRLVSGWIRGRRVEINTSGSAPTRTATSGHGVSSTASSTVSHSAALAARQRG